MLAIEKDARLVEVLRERFNVGQASRLSSKESPGQARRLSYNCSTTTRWNFCDASGAIGANGNSSPTCRTPWPRRSWWSWRRANARRSGWWSRCNSKSRGGSWPNPATRITACSRLLVQLDYEAASDWFKIPASCFFPEPDVDSACVCLVRRAQTPLSAEQREAFVRIVKRAFSQRRKMMMKLLRTIGRSRNWKSVFAAAENTTAGARRRIKPRTIRRAGEMLND